MTIEPKMSIGKQDSCSVSFLPFNDFSFATVVKWIDAVVKFVWMTRDKIPNFD